MADGSNLKARIGMDTGDFEKGAKKVVKAAQGMGKDIGSSLAEVSDALGVNVGVMGQLATRIGNVTTLFRGMANTGGGAISSLTKAMTGLGGAIAGLGITAAITAFRELNREAESFKYSLQGANLAASASAFRQTYAAALDDATGGKGGKFAAWLEEFKTNWATDWANITHLGADQNARNWATQTAQQAADLASEMVDLNKAASDMLVSQAQYQKDINEQLKIAVDTSKTKGERDKAQAEAVRLVNERYDEQLSLQRKIAENLAKRNSLTGDTTPQQLEEQRRAEAAVISLEAQREMELKSLVRLENRIAGAKTSQVSSAKETEEATALTLAAATELVVKQRELKALQDQNAATMFAARTRLDGALPAIAGGPLSQASGMAIEVPIRPVVDTNATQKAILDLADVIEQGVVGMSEALGGLIADLVNGENAWGNFAQAGIAVVADMLATVGKAFIAEGVGVIAAQRALQFGAGPGAIAAGAAMVAIASTMRAAMSNAASGWGGGYSSSVASSSYTQGAYGQSTFGREMTVQVTGTLTANGSKLVAVLNNEGKRKDLTT